MQPLAQDFTIVARSPARDVFTREPALIQLPSRRLMATFACLSQRGHEIARGALGAPLVPDIAALNVCISDDHGASWHPRPALSWEAGMPMVIDGALYLIGNRPGRRDIVITRSADEGLSWAPEATLFAGQFWNCPTAIAFRNGFVYRAFGGDEAAGRETLVIAGDASRDLMDPASWRMSNRLPFPGMPREMVRDAEPGSSHWLEPHVVPVGERLYVLSTVKITNSQGWATPGLVALCELDDHEGALRYRFVQYHPAPGGQLKFHIVHDDVSRLYWRTMNLPANTTVPPDPRWEKRGNFGGDRRLLALSYSLDALNWIQAGCVAITPRPWEGFQYAMPLIDGDDLLVIARTSLDGVNQHESNLITLHRVRDFRSLAVGDIHPRFDGTS